MLKLTPDPQFDVVVPVPVAGGQDEPVVLTMRHMGRKQIKDYLARAKEGDEVDSIAEITVAWRDVDVPFSRDALAELLDNYPALASRIIQAWMDELMQAPVKN